jgi:heavy metal sensor kinase
MSLKKATDLFRHLSFRLTLWYGLSFTVCGVLLLLVFYIRVAYVTREQVDEELIEEVSDFTELMQADGLEAVISYLRAEEKAELPGTLFLRLFSPDGTVLAATDDAAWGGPIPLNRHELEIRLPQGRPHIETLSIAGHSARMRSVYSALSNQVWLQIGLSLQESEEYLEIFRQLLLWILAPLVLLAGAVGWFMARQALADVDAVTRTAEEIAGGHPEKRVAVIRHFVEIDRLAGAFNAMVDQLHALIDQMREMTDNIAHDLRSPLTRIRGFAEMTLIGNRSPDDFQEMAVSTVEECDNLIDMINTMLDIAEAESGIAPITTEPVDLTALVDDALSLYSSLAYKKGIDLHRESPARAVIMADRAKYQRMVANLLENAIKYTPAGGQVTVSVTLRNEAACIQVRDTGVGIAPEEQPRIFQRFYRCDASRSEAGMGLGLSLARALAESLGGSLSVRSVPHKGSIFRLSIPARTPA